MLKVFGAVGSGSIPVEATLTLLGIPYELVEARHLGRRSGAQARRGRQSDAPGAGAWSFHRARS